VISIAAGGAADGSESVHFDLFGMMPKPAKHAKVYGNLYEFCVKAYQAFADDVRTGGYPQKEHGWGMDPVELESFLNQLEHAGTK
jgi:3-methyl-2-oxobutanoate hydroxymethyltransferase